MPAWPVSISFKPSPGTYSEQPLDNVIRTSFDFGPEVTRRRFTAVPTNISFSLPPMLQSDFTTFKTFYDVDLEHGSLAFTADHPITGVNESFRFAAPYSVGDVLPYLSVSLSLLLLP